MAAIHLHPQTCADAQMTCMPAFSVLAPRDWQTTGSICWTPQNLMHSVTASFTSASPQGHACLQLHQNASFAWAPRGLPAEGGSAFGVEVARPRPALDLLTQILLPRARPGLTQLTVIEAHRDPSPPWGSSGPQRVSPNDDCLHAVVEYEWRGLRWREETRVTVQVSPAQPMPTGMWGATTPVTFWFALPALSIVAPAARWDDHKRLLTTLRDSFRLSQAWIQAVERVFAQLRAGANAQAARMQQQTFAMQRQIGRTLAETSDVINHSWHDQQAVYDRVYDNQHLATMGVGRYEDPTLSAPVELTAGYAEVWSDGLGDYILSDTTAFDPNTDPALNSHATWQRLPQHGL